MDLTALVQLLFLYVLAGKLHSLNNHFYGSGLWMRIAYIQNNHKMEEANVSSAQPCGEPGPVVHF